MSVKALLDECRIEAFTGDDVDRLARLEVSIRYRPLAGLDDRTLATAITLTRVVRSKLERHRQLNAGAL